MQYTQPVYAGNESAKAGKPAQALTYAPFEYIGKTALTVVGNATGIRYRFNAPGDRQNVDFRDIPGIAGIAVLRKVT